MTYPSNVSLVTVTGYWSNSDGSGPASGTVTFTPNATLQDGTSTPANIVTPKALKATLVNGAISVQLMATDDPHLSPSGWTYTVVENIDSQSAVRTYSIELPAANPTVDLTAVAVVTTPPAQTAYVQASAVGASGGVASLDGTANVPLSQLSNLKTQYAAVAQLPASNGIDDTATVNAVLAANAGRRVRGLPGQTYLMTAPPVVWSGQELDMTGCTVNLKAGSNCNLLQNAAVSAVTRLTDAAMAAGSAVLTSASGKFASAMVNKPITVQGAGTGGTPLTTTVASYQSATQITLAASAATTVSGQYAAVGPRDSNITVTGGTWIRSNPNGGSPNGWDRHSLRFRHCDGLTIKAITVQSSSDKYAVSTADCNDVAITSVQFATFSDGVHVAGPSARIHVSDVHGTTGDDAVAITPRDWTAYDDAFGDVTDVTVENIYATSTNAAVLKLLGGCAAPLTSLKRVDARGLHGAGNNNGVFIGDDTAQPNTTGGLLTDVLVADIHTTVPNAQSVVYMTASNAKDIRLSGLRFNNPNTVGGSSVIQFNGANAAVLGTLVIEDVHVAAIGPSNVVQIDANGDVVTRCVVSGLSIASAAAGAVGVFVKGTITDLAVRGALAALTGSSYLVSLSGSDPTAAINRLTISDAHVVGGSGLIQATANGHTLPNVDMVNVTQSGTSWLADLNTVTEMHLSSVTHKNPTQGIMNIRANGNVTVRGDGLAIDNGGKGFQVASGGQVSDLRRDTTALSKANNLSDLSDLSAALTNLSAAKTVDIQSFTVPGSYTWTKPAGAKLVEVIVIGGGGGGGSGRRGAAGTVRCGGGGGGGGGLAVAKLNAADLPASCPLIVGAGGGGGSSFAVSDNSDGQVGGGGGVSVFNDVTTGTSNASRVKAAGGSGGAGGTATNGGGGNNNFSPFNGAAGGSASGSGGNGNNGSDPGPGAAGGGAGAGITSGDAGGLGGGGGVNAWLDQARAAGGTAGGSPAGSGANGRSTLSMGPGNGAGGGGSTTTGAGGTGGVGGMYGGGGGGGGASLNGNPVGAGGKGGDGAVFVTTYF